MSHRAASPLKAMASPWKGKAHEDNSEDLNPVLTYRHLLSSGLGVRSVFPLHAQNFLAKPLVDRNPLRVCGLTDMDAFYAACEQNRLKLDPGSGKINYRVLSDCG